MHKQAGFSLLEIMVVLALLGIIVSTVSFTSIGEDKQKLVEQEAQRLQVVFDMASDFAVLNQQQLGLLVDEEKQTYAFVQLGEDEQWLPLNEPKIFAEYTLPEFFSLQINLDNLAWQQEDSLFDNQLFDEELSVSNDSVRIGDEEDAPPPPPQVFILSSADITPFELRLRWQDSFSEQPPIDVYISGQDFTPLTLSDRPVE